MTELQIKSEALPNRCEICHQSDCFNPEKNYCARCAETEVTRNVPLLIVNPKYIFLYSVLSPFKLLYIMRFGGFYGLLIAYIISKLGLSDRFTILAFIFVFILCFSDFIKDEMRSYKHTSVLLYDRRMELKFEKQTLSIDYQDINNVELVKGIMDKIYKIGTIILYVRKLDKPIIINNVDNPDEICQKIRTLVKE